MDAKSDPSHGDSDSNSCGSSTVGDTDIDSSGAHTHQLNGDLHPPSDVKPASLNACSDDSVATHSYNAEAKTENFICRDDVSESLCHEGISYKDRQGDGAEDVGANRVVEEIPTQRKSAPASILSASTTVRTGSDKTVEQNTAVGSGKTVSVSSLASGVYIAKSSKDTEAGTLKGLAVEERFSGFPRVGSEASVLAAEARHAKRERRHQHFNLILLILTLCITNYRKNN